MSEWISLGDHRFKKEWQHYGRYKITVSSFDDKTTWFIQIGGKSEGSYIHKQILYGYMHCDVETAKQRLDQMLEIMTGK